MSQTAATLPNPVSDGRLSLLLLAAAAMLFVVQIVLGTSTIFAFGVFATLAVTVAILHGIGLASIPGILIAYCMFRYVVFSQIAKSLLGQAGDSNLAAPDATIAVLLLGTMSIGAAALLVKYFLGGKILLRFEVSPGELTDLRNATFLVGTVCSLVVLHYDHTAEGETAYGGIAAIGGQFIGLSYIGIIAETLRILIASNGRRSLTPALAVMFGVNFGLGLLFGSKQGLAGPFLAYILTSFGYRRRLTRKQTIGLGSLLLAGVLFLYPLVNSTRSQIRSENQTIEESLRSIGDMALDTGSLYATWRDWYTESPWETNLHTSGLFYLGLFDPLLSRFLLISNTDVIVDSVRRQGPYGMDLVLDGFRISAPTFLLADKPRFQTCDLVPWFYGLLPAGLVTLPTIGLFADSFATLEWPGILIIPFCIMVPYFLLLQCAGSRISANILGTYLLAVSFHGFGEASAEGFIVDILRLVPLNIIAVLVLRRAARLSATLFTAAPVARPASPSGD